MIPQSNRALWQRVEFLSDVHLHVDEPDTARAWMDGLRHSQADAIFILGDLFEVWIGDDDDHPFVADCVNTLYNVTRQRPVFFMHGNRDFLAGTGLMQASGMQLLPDPFTLDLSGVRLVLSHGDLLCLEDMDYLAFRAQVRTAEWQKAFLNRPLAERRAMANAMRAQSEAHKQTMTQHADVDPGMATLWLQNAQAQVLVHGHTHRPGEHALQPDAHGQPPRTRWCLSDWDANAQPPRLEMTVWQREDAHNAHFGLSRQSLALSA